MKLLYFCVTGSRNDWSSWSSELFLMRHECKSLLYIIIAHIICQAFSVSVPSLRNTETVLHK